MDTLHADGKRQRGRSVSGLFKHLPNLLTALRVVCAPALAILLFVGADRAALGIFAFAGFSDAADGFLAKRFGLATPLGRYLDPAADKLLMLAAFLALTFLGCAPPWLAALVVARDMSIIVGVAIAHVLALPLRIAPLAIGKLSTAAQVIYVAFSLFLLAFAIHWQALTEGAAVATGAVTAASWFAYAALWVKAFSLRPRRVA
jgi:cardiolipin synthase (CMP-forming)